MPRHVAWFNEASITLTADGSLASADPVVRQRCLVPARELEKHGIECSVFGNLHDADPLHVGNHLQKLNTDIVVIGKISGPSLLKLARAAKHLGCYVVADLGTETTLSPEFLKLIDITDQIVAASPEAAAIILEKTGLSALVVPDCDESDQPHSPEAIAKLWLDCFKHLRMKPPACANTNVPETP